MDPFTDDRPELNGTLISMEFGPGGRIVQLWASDPALPEEGEDFQFVLPPLSFGEEVAEDLYPGTILLGARTDPDSPWILSRNGNAQPLLDFDSDDDDYELTQVGFEYDFPLLPEIQGTGKFYEIPGVIPQIAWELEIRNRGNVSIEIGELGFPLALNTFYDGFGWSDEQLKMLWTSRLYVHKYIGGAASWLFAQRMTADPPGLLIFPGEDTSWEFFSHVRASLNTPHQWEGIPTVYVYSRASVEREGWKGWSNEHTSLILEPGDSRTFHMRFVPTDRDKQDGVYQTLAALGRPVARLLPSAVAPIDVGTTVEVQGSAPRRFFLSREAEVEIDLDDDRGYCYLRPQEPGPLRLSYEDGAGRLSHVHLMFTEPIESLIKKRAAYIAETQLHREKGSRLDHAILLTDIESGERVTDAEEYRGASGIECGLADALFLAEKNTIYPDKAQIKLLDAAIADFLLDDVQNPGDMTVGSVLAEEMPIGTYMGRPMTYPVTFNLYHAMYRVAKGYGETREQPQWYLRNAALTALALFRYGWRHYVRTVGLEGYARVYEILDDLAAEGLTDLHEQLDDLVASKAEELVKQTYPYAGESVLDTSGMEDVFAAARYLQNDEHLERTMRCAYAARSLAPSWWWYGSDKRSWDGADSTPMRALVDRGEACLAHTTIANSLMFFQSLDRDYLALPDAYMRLAFGGMMGPWALVRSDGAASMCYCPDLASKHHGYNRYTGSSGLGYYHYLRGVGAYILPNKTQGFYAFGCHVGQEDQHYLVRPWDGVGRRIVMRQIGAEFEIHYGKIDEIALDIRKRWFKAILNNPADKEMKALMRVRGLWGRQVNVAGKVVDNVEGETAFSVLLPASGRIQIEGKIVR